MLYLHAVMHQRRIPLRLRWRTLLLLGVGAALALPRALTGHEVPERVAVLGYVQAEGDELRVLLRVPLEAMRDMEFPLRVDGALDLVRVGPLLRDAAQTWLADYIEIDEDGRPLATPRIAATRVSLPSDRAFETFAAARAHLARPPLGDEATIRWQQALFDVQLVYRIGSADAAFVLRPALAHLGIRTTSALHIVAADGSERLLTYEGNPDHIALDPRWYDAALQFTAGGFRHILGGFDHLLFIICLVLPIRRWRTLVATVTAFTLAHSLTLAAAALGLVPHSLWFPPLVETAIAASIVWLALENIVLPEERLSERWMVAFGFGLIHGFGFSFALQASLQFAGSHLVTALAAFNLGVELGQLAVLALAFPLLWMLRRHVGASQQRLLTIVGSAVIAHVAWHWMTARGATVAAYRSSLAWPVLDATFALAAMRVALLLTLALALALTLRHILRTLWRP